MAQATAALRDHLGAIDLADQRKGFWLGVLGSMAFNVLLVIVIALAEPILDAFGVWSLT